MLVTAESCTGGALAAVLSSVPGSAEWFDRGFVTYSDYSKQDALGVRAATLREQGPVSEAVAREMALGGLAHSAAQVSIAIAGIAGHVEGAPRQPVGTVCFAWAVKGIEPCSWLTRYDGDREMIREQVVAAALQGLLDALASAKLQ